MASFCEVAEICKLIHIGEEENVYCIEAETTSSLEKLPFYVLAESTSIREGLVYYYNRENLKERGTGLNLGLSIFIWKGGRG